MATSNRNLGSMGSHFVVDLKGYGLQYHQPMQNVRMKGSWNTWPHPIYPTSTPHFHVGLSRRCPTPKKYPKSHRHPLDLIGFFCQVSHFAYPYQAGPAGQHFVQLVTLLMGNNELETGIN